MNNEPLDNTLSKGGDTRSQTDKFAEYYHAVRERFWIVLLCLVLGAIGSAIKIALIVPNTRRGQFFSSSKSKTKCSAT